MTRGLVRGAAAGAAGATALNAATYLDMAVRDRPASDTPEQVVSALAQRVGLPAPAGARRTAAGALAGMVTGSAVGALAGLLRSAGLRLPTAVGGPLLGAAAMAASDVPMALLGVSDPRQWTAVDWLSDAAPHLVYGVTTHAALVAGEAAVNPAELAARRACLVKGAALGAATGGRSSAGMTAVSLTTAPEQVPGMGAKLISRNATVVNALLAVGELVGDKLPQAPARTSLPGLLPRVVFGATSSALVAQRDGGDALLGAIVGGAAASATARLGVAWRSWASDRFGSDRPGALIEDAVVYATAFLGARRG